MRRLLVVVLMLGLAGSAMAANVGTVADTKPAGGIYNQDDYPTRVGGDVIPGAVIGSLPYYDGGNTCGFVNNYDEICPYSGSTSPDVVYSYTPGANTVVKIDLCASTYDTKVYVYQNAQGNLVACNDDAGCGYSGWQSLLENIQLVAGNTYYIVVDGYGGGCGDYSLAITEFEPCVVECQGVAEGEPPCADNYFDTYNGGCNTSGWIAIAPAPGSNCNTICGKSCTYLYQGLGYRDTDWYTTEAQGGTMSGTCNAEFPLQFILIYGTDCNNLVYDLATAGACTPTTLSYNAAAGAEIWWWVGSSAFDGIPESDYSLEVCGIAGGTPVEETTWGQIKNNNW